MMKSRVDEATMKIYRTLLERFGEPIGDAPAVPGVPDARQEEGDVCQSCGESGSLCQCGMNEITETRDRVARGEVEQTWEDLYLDGGPPSLEQLASWLGATEDAVMASLPRYLMVDDDGQVVEKGLGSNPPPAMKTPNPAYASAMAEGKKKKGMTKAQAKGLTKGTKKFSDKVARAKKHGLKNPEGAAAKAMKITTGKWPGEK